MFNKWDNINKKNVECDNVLNGKANDIIDRYIVIKKKKIPKRERVENQGGLWQCWTPKGRVLQSTFWTSIIQIGTILFGILHHTVLFF